MPGSTVLWNGEDRIIGFVNEFMLTAAIRASDVAAALLPLGIVAWLMRL